MGLSKEEISQDIVDVCGSPYPVKHTEYVQEQLEKVAKYEAIEFLCWIDGEGFECFLHTDENIKMWKAFGEGQIFSTETLYNIFLQSKNK